MNKTKGFTLIELLVVISIVSFLSSIILASLNTAREKGRIAAGQKFDAHTEQAYGAEALGWWDFDEQSGTTAYDRSGNNFHGTLSAGATRVSGIKGKAVSLSNGSQVTVGSVPLFKDGSFTISAWIYLTDYTTGYGYNVVFQDTYPTEGIAFGVRGSYDGSAYKKLGFWSDGLGTSLATGQTVPLNEWHHILFTWNKSTGKAKVYYDGTEKGSVTTAKYTPGVGYYFVPSPTRALVIGGTDGYFNGLIDEVKIYGEALSTAQVEKIYAEARPSQEKIFAQNK